MLVCSVLKNLKCKRCGNAWIYKGTNPYCASCSHCKSTVFIKESSLGQVMTVPDEDNKSEDQNVIENPQSVLEQ
jgi:hypothetical protein